MKICVVSVDYRSAGHEVLEVFVGDNSYEESESYLRTLGAEFDCFWFLGEEEIFEISEFEK